jgi:hypothetical protein
VSPRARLPVVLAGGDERTTRLLWAIPSRRTLATQAPCLLTEAQAPARPLATHFVRLAVTRRPWALRALLFCPPQKFLAFVLLFWERRVVVRLTTANLVAHRLRNRKTMVMYALSLSFIVFITGG